MPKTGVEPANVAGSKPTAFTNLATRAFIRHDWSRTSIVSNVMDFKSIAFHQFRHMPLNIMQ